VIRVTFQYLQNGPGISPDRIEQLFRPFTTQPVAASSSAIYPGSSIGLYVSREVGSSISFVSILDFMLKSFVL
jgi:signal transduction histidine kinase